MFNKKTILGIILGIIITPLILLSAPPSGSVYRTILPEADSTYDIGTSILRWANGYFDNVDTDTITVSGLVVGDLDMGGNNITNGGTATFENFVATSTTATNYFLGNVGIGTTAPLAKLHVFGEELRLDDNDPTLTFRRNSAGAYGGHIDWETQDGTLSWQVGTNILVDANTLEFNRAGSNLMVIKNTGNVGIGKTSPVQKLDVTGGAAISGNVGIGTTAPSTILNIGSATSNQNNTLKIQTQNAGSNTPAIYLDWNTDGFGRLEFPFDTRATAGLKLGTFENYPISLWSNSLQRVTVLGDGNVGIGTASPLSKLHINGGTGTLATGLSFGDGDTGFYESSDDILWLVSGGSKIADITGTGIFANDNNGFALRNQAASATNPNIGANRLDSNTGIGSAGADILSLIAGGVNGLNVTGAGNIGIGTTTPRVKLDVNGIIYQNGTYGEIHLADGSTLQSIPTGATYTKLTGFTDDGLSNNVTPAVATDNITLTKAGVYRCSSSQSGASATVTTFQFAIFLNGVEQHQCHNHRKYANANDNGSSSITGFMRATTTPVSVDLRAKHNNGGSVNFTPSYMNLNVEYVGE